MTTLAILITVLLLAVAFSFVQQSRRPDHGPIDAPPQPLDIGTAVLLCHKLSDRRTEHEMETQWLSARAALVKDQAGKIEHRSYAQVVQVSRWNTPYILVRLSRSWLITAPLSKLHGLPAPDFADGDTADAEDWDMIELLDFADTAAAKRFLTGKRAAEAREALLDDVKAWASHSQAVPMAANRAFLQTAMAEGSAVALFCLRARAELGRDGMLDYWLGRHRPLVQHLQPVLDYAWYDQLTARGAEPLADPAEALSHNAGTPWDGVANLGYRQLKDLVLGVFDPRVQAANVKLVYDEARFLDQPRCSLLLGEVHHVSHSDVGDALVTQR